MPSTYLGLDGDAGDGGDASDGPDDDESDGWVDRARGAGRARRAGLANDSARMIGVFLSRAMAAASENDAAFKPLEALTIL